MSKVVKIKESDIKKLVLDVLKEQEDYQGSEDPEIKDLAKQSPEELSSENGVPLRLAKDEEGNFYVFQDDGSEDPKATKLT
jgi:hypothetical protein|tara:strand:+ start:881 stop:1123 length:243 start_codon:yes stop_codon:yes gene_type:complete